MQKKNSDDFSQGQVHGRYMSLNCSFVGTMFVQSVISLFALVCKSG
jgi:hypothetical protein